jgi:hypothetical protein
MAMQLDMEPLGAAAGSRDEGWSGPRAAWHRLGLPSHGGVHREAVT